jgi:hypothetical protein
MLHRTFAVLVGAFPLRLGLLSFPANDRKSGCEIRGTKCHAY